MQALSSHASDNGTSLLWVRWTGDEWHAELWGDRRILDRVVLAWQNPDGRCSKKDFAYIQKQLAAAAPVGPLSLRHNYGERTWQT